MPSLFHRRSRSLSTQRPQPASASSNAHVAATQAFLANRVSQGNLSASAAAAALRAMSPPPTAVGEVQTKRMQRRSSSASSANAPRGRVRGGGLERKASSGSMTERTFRSPSPGRPATSDGTITAPPVPALPQDIPPVPQIKERRSQRALSEDTHGRRQKIPAAATPALVAATLSARTNGSPTIQRTDSKSSINFSYPRPQSPPPPQTIPASPQVSQRVSSSGISAAEAAGVQHSVAAAAQQPVKKKKKKIAPGGAAGSHLSAGSMASKPIVTPLEPGPELSPGLPQEQPGKRKKKKLVATGESSHFPPTDSAVLEQEPEVTPESIRRAQRASGVLMKQPSVVREDWEGEQEEIDVATDAERREGEGLSLAASPPIALPSKKTTAANMSRKIEEPVSPSPKPAEPEIYHAVTQSTAEANTDYLKVAQPDSKRQSSISPSRSTRFSDNIASDLSTGRKHDPLPRSVSPVKSALKHHSPSPAGDRKGRGNSPSEASDSNHSADGSARRKKSARVSFEPDAEVVGVAAEPVGSDSPIVASPQNKEAKKGGFFSLGRSRPALNTIPSEDDLDEHMQPRPQLPSFGSVRNKTRRVDSSDSVEQTTSSTAETFLTSPANQTSYTSSESSSLNVSTSDRGSSSDHAVGAVLAKHAGQKPATEPARNLALPLPPVVTSREGQYVSDSESNYSDDELTPTPAVEGKDLPVGLSQSSPKIDHQATVLTEASADQATSSKTKSHAPPAVEIHPPTPGHDEDKPGDQWLVEVPGGFPAAFENTSKSVETHAPATPEVRRTFGPSEAELAKLKAVAEEDEGVSDNDSIYSDAAEEPEGDGFGSINAIVESPIVPSPVRQSPSETPLAGTPTQTPTEVTRTTSWDGTQQHWKDIAQQSRQIQATSPQKATQHLQEITNPQPPTVAPTLVKPKPPAQAATVNKPKPKKKTGTAALGAAVAAIPAAQRPQPAEAKPQHIMKSSMRQGGGQGLVSDRASGTMRTSMRQQGDSNPRSLKASKWAAEPARPKSPVQTAPPTASSRAALQKKYIPPASTAPTPKATPKPVAPVVNDESDSDSSFKRTRKNNRSSNGGYNMRSSMRAPAQASAPSQLTGRAAVRSLSPPVRRPFSPAGDPKTMRTSMRGSTDAQTPTLRQPSQQKRSSSLFSMRKAKSPERAAPLPLTAKIRSRIDDSDDEDEPRPTTFRSRFADSSDDEDDAQPLRPVRGIPRRQDDGDSTDLEDSSDEERKKKRQLQPAIKIDTAAAQKAAPAADVPLSPNTMKKKGLFSRFRSKNKKDDNLNTQRNGAPTAPAATDPNNTSRPISKEDETPFESNMGFGSSAERDAMIKQTMAKLEAAKHTDPATPPPKPQLDEIPEIARPQSPVGGKLQRRRPERVMSDSWPLPESPATPTNDRPATAGASPAFGKHKVNGVSTLRPPNERRPTSETYATDGGSPVSGSKAKKKRFPMLRKAFGLKD